MTIDEMWTAACDNAEAALECYDRGEASKEILRNVIAGIRRGGRSNAELRTYWPSVQKYATRPQPEPIRDLNGKQRVQPPENPSAWAATGTEALLRCAAGENDDTYTEEDAARAAVAMTESALTAANHVSRVYRGEEAR